MCTYSSLEDAELRAQSLRDRGLTEGEIKLWLEHHGELRVRLL